MRDLLEPLNGCLAVEERGALLEEEVLRLENIGVDEHALECQSDDIYDLRSRCQRSVLDDKRKWGYTYHFHLRCTNAVGSTCLLSTDAKLII